MTAVVRWLMKEVIDARRRQLQEREQVFTELGQWKDVCPKELAHYHEWHAKRGLKQQTEWIDDPSTERAWQQIHEIDRFLVHYRTIQPIIASSHAQSNIASSPIHSNGPTSPDPCPANLKGVPASTWPQSRTAHTPCSLIRWLLSEDQLSIKPLPTTPKTESTSKTAPRDS
jgi:hypothetical protein